MNFRRQDNSYEKGITYDRYFFECMKDGVWITEEIPRVKDAA